MSTSPVRSIRNAQKEKLFYREISQLFMHLTQDDPRVQGLQIIAVQLSSDGGICYVLFYSPEGLSDFEAKLPYLKMYKPSLRKSLAHAINARYTPDIMFRYDDTYEKRHKLEELLDKVKHESNDINDADSE